jgi:hypothetical protein
MMKTPGAVLNGTPVPRTRSEIDALLQETRWRIHQASYEEQRLETELRVTEVELCLGEAWIHQAEGRFGPALKLLQDLKKVASSLPHQHDHFIAEIDILERKLALPRTRRDVEQLLSDAAGHFHSGKPSLAAQPLDAAMDLLAKLPGEGTVDLYDKYLRLDGAFQSVRRPSLERFKALRTSFDAKIASRVGDVRRLSRTDTPVRSDVLGNLLDQVSVAEGILASLDPALVGLQDHERAAQDFGDLRGVLIELLHESAEASRTAVPGLPEPPAAASSPRMPAVSGPAPAPTALAVPTRSSPVAPLAARPATPLPAVSAPVVPPVGPPAPSSQEKLGLNLSPWAMGSWGTLRG